MMKKILMFVCSVLLVFGATTSYAAYINYTDFATFQAASGPLTTIDFTGVASGTSLTTEFSGLGVTFDGSDTVELNSAFVNDGIGVNCNGICTLQFSNPLTAIGVDFPGAITFDLYDVMGGTLLYSSADFGQSGTGFFGGVGVISDTPFSYAVISDWFEPNAFFDDIHFSTAVPEPGTMLLLGTGLIGLAYSRRKMNK